MEFSFTAELLIIGINPYVEVPEPILQQLFELTGKSRGAVPVKGLVNEKPYRQTLVRYLGEWRLYINTEMLKNSPRRIGESLSLTIQPDFDSREVVPPAAFLAVLQQHGEAMAVFERLSPSRRNEIVRYLARLKNEAVLQRNIDRAIGFLLGRERFVGRDKP